ncbi:MAG: HAD-IIA family hydrolase [Actinomycetota bacterium]|nr:HAD-IIA family hydrolase [Actinomycetota bacterium]MDQ2788346.1 HAD-IIA family hydrolase [Actinomycetota bacterium]
MTSLLDAHDALLFDLDGTLFRGGTVLPGAIELVARAARNGHRIGYVTNNGSRRPRQVAAHLSELGFAAAEDEVVTSGLAAALLLAERLPAGARVLVVGTADLRQEVLDAGLTVTDRADDATSVVQGHSPETGWPLLAEACLAIRAGALWVACNVDATLPTERGELPGNGSMVAALRTATGAEPLVAGKPEPWLFTEAVRRTGATRPLVIGDRLDTDIAGANAAGLPVLAVLTGVSDARSLLEAAARDRPRYVGADLGALDEAVEVTEVAARPPWLVRSDEAGLTLDTNGTDASSGSSDPVAALRALCAVHWATRGGEVDVRAGDGAAADALCALGLSAG